MEKLPRKKPHERRKGFYRHVMNDVRHDILASIAEMPWMKTEAVYDRHPYRNQAIIRIDLRFMHSEGLLDHIKPPYGTGLGLPHQHTISDAGRIYLQSKGLLRPPLVEDPEGKRVRAGEPRRFEMHTDMHINLVSNLKGAAGERMAVRREIIGDKALELPFTASHDGMSKKGTLRPDDLFRFQRGDILEYFFYEGENTSPVSRTNLEGSSFYRKVLAYFNIIAEQRLHKTELGINKIRVLVTGPTLERIEHKMHVVEHLWGKSDVFLFQVVPPNGKFPDLFTTPWYRVGLPPISLDTGV
jgi:hypothetical protein